MIDLQYFTGNHAEFWEVVEEDHLDGDSLTYGTLYRFPIFDRVAPGETVVDASNIRHTAPSAPGLYTLYKYVQDGTLQGFRWEM